MATIIDPLLVERYVMDLARHGAVGETGVARTVYTPAWTAAQDEVARHCAEAGLSVRRDAVGNVWGRAEGTGGGGAIVSGSHIDSQTPGGRYDGALGVISAVIAVRALLQQFGAPRRSIEVLSLCEEEESRFHARWWGSRAITGAIDPSEADSIVDQDGISIGEAMRGVGLDPAGIGSATRHDLDVFLELHIEQGPLLEEAGLPLAVVHAITGLRHTLVELEGRADHAGARPMGSRLDPMAGAAEAISGVIEEALRMGAPAVTTVGRMEVEPNLAAAVPEKVRFTVDARHPEPQALQELLERQESLIQRVAARRGLKVRTRRLIDYPPCVCDPELVALLERTAARLGVPARMMHSGAGHDSQVMARAARVAMIFVRSIGGRSHTPAELTTAEDAARGVEVLAAAIHELAY